MTETQAKVAAKKYVSEQLDAMKKSGRLAKNVSKSEYEKIVKQVMKASGK